MSSQARVVVIGGGVVGCSVLYHLTRLGWTDVMLLERAELTAGSTWHAAGGMHTLNGDVNMASLQAYTIRLYKEIEEASGQSCGIHRVGCLYLAGTADRHDFFRSERAKARHLGIDMEFVSLEEARRINPLLDTSGFVAALFDPNDGHVDPNGVTNAYAKAARANGAEVHRHTPVTALRPTKDGWRVATPQGTIEAEYVVNAAGLWAREVAALAGVRLPVVPMEHQYVVTNEIEAVAALPHEVPMTIDFEGENYLRQEGRGLLIGTYEPDCRHWGIPVTPADFGHELIAPDLDRISEALEVAMQAFPCLREGGIKRIVNGGMVFAPDGNPVIGPVRGLRNFYVACGVMAGFSQGGGVGLAVAQWIAEGDPGMDVFAMDVARFGDYATVPYTLEKTRENYRRRFAMTFPNEELIAARPCKTTPVYERLKSAGAAFGAAFGWEYPLWYAAAGRAASETPSFRRTEAFARVGEECRALRTGVGLWETSTYSKYEVSGPGAGAFLDRLGANRLPARDGRIALCPLLTPRGRILGDLTVARLDAERYLMFGSGPAEIFYLRWFERHLPDGGVAIRNMTAALTGFSISGPKSRELLAAMTGEDVSDAAFRFLAARRLPIGPVEALVLRISFTGELGYEIYVAPEYQLAVYETLVEKGREFGLRHIGVRALNSLRLEKGYGSWGREFSPDYTPAEAGLARLVRLDKGDFIGRAAAGRDLAHPPSRRLSILTVTCGDADPIGNEPVFHVGSVVGRVTSGSFGHTVGQAITLAYLPARTLDRPEAFEIEILGDRRPARLAPAALYDPQGAKLRG